MINIPYWTRIVALLALAVAMMIHDRRKGSVVRQWEYGCVLLAGVVGAVYGAVHDAITVSISSEYFAIGKNLGFGPSLRSDAVRLGLQAGFSAAVIACSIWLFTLRHTAAQHRCRLIARMAWLPVGTALVLSTVGGSLLYRLDPLHLHRQLGGTLSETQIRAFVTVWWIHMGAYLGVILGLIAGIVKTRKQGAEPNQAGG